MKVEKRDGRIVEFDKSKIENALKKSGITSEKDLPRLLHIIEVKLGDRDVVTVSDIQKEVETTLMQEGYYEIARDYISYRYLHDVAREKYTKLTQTIKEKIFASNVENSNANMDEKSFGGRKGEMANAILKEFALNNCMSDMAKSNHLNNEIYQHDLDSYALGIHNCLSLPIDKLFKNGFTTRQVDIRPAQSINTAFQLLAVVFQVQSLSQFGGVSVTHLDWSMVPYVRKSFYKHYKTGKKYLCNEDFNLDNVEEISISSNEYKKDEKAYKYAYDMTVKELNQAVEGMYHNLRN